MYESGQFKFIEGVHNSGSEKQECELSLWPALTLMHVPENVNIASRTSINI